MIDRKAIRKKARKHVRGHYALLVLICAVAILFGDDFHGIMSNAQNLYDMLTDQVTEIEIIGIKGRRETASKIVKDMIEDRLAAGDAYAAEGAGAGEDPNPVLGRSRGVFAAAVNNIRSGRMYAMIGTGLNNIVHSRELANALLVAGGLALQMLVWVLVINMLGVVLRRAFLETRAYAVFPMNHMFHLIKVRRWIRASLTMLLAVVYETLWSLTLVGGFIKHYSYFLVPYIVAENPDIRPREAIRLSRRMMNGHKWECFLLDLSFLGWELLGYLTFGIGNVLWTTPYHVAAYTEYYAILRQKARESAVPGAERLNDEYLYAPAGAEALNSAYGELARHMGIIDEDILELTPRQRFFARNFGIWTASLDEKLVYSRQENLRQRTRISRLELEGKAYPQRLNPLWTRESAALSGRVNFLAPCTVWSLIVVFFMFCIFGWLWEVSLHLITDGTFVNRGFLHGPWLPIYGSGVVMIAVLLYRLRRKPALEALAVMVLCGTVEYLTSYFMELAHGVRWWDYTGYFLNLNGRICLEGLAVFAVGGMAAVYLLVPIIDAFVTRRIKPKLLISVCVALLVCFAGDMVYSRFVPNMGEGVTDTGKDATIVAEAKAEKTAAVEP